MQHTLGLRPDAATEGHQDREEGQSGSEAAAHVHLPDRRGDSTAHSFTLGNRGSSLSKRWMAQFPSVADSQESRRPRGRHIFGLAVSPVRGCRGWQVEVSRAVFSPSLRFLPSRRRSPPWRALMHVNPPLRCTNTTTMTSRATSTFETLQLGACPSRRSSPSGSCCQQKGQSGTWRYASGSLRSPPALRLTC